jgi:hypothetical protein
VALQERTIERESVFGAANSINKTSVFEVAMG